MMTQLSFIQIPLELINYVRRAKRIFSRSLHLSETQYDLWLYLLCKDSSNNIPSLTQSARELEVNSKTIQRAFAKILCRDGGEE